MPSLPSHDEMVANVLRAYNRATPAQCVSGRDWYPLAGRIVATIATATETHPSRIAHALAALSPRNPWRWNVADAYAFAMAHSEGRTMPKATTFKGNQLRAWEALATEVPPWLSDAPKVTNFVAAIMGDSEAVVIDVWAMRVATAYELDAVPSDKAYEKVTAAYRDAAAEVFEGPRDMQAITWIVATTERLATRARWFKRGTADEVLDMFGAPVQMRLIP